MEGDRSRISARAEASPGAVMTSSNGIPASFVISQPRMDQDEYFLLLMVSVVAAMVLLRCVFTQASDMPEAPEAALAQRLLDLKGKPGNPCG